MVKKPKRMLTNTSLKWVDVLWNTLTEDIPKILKFFNFTKSELTICLIMVVEHVQDTAGCGA